MADQLIGLTRPRPNLMPENYPAERELARRHGIGRARLGTPAVAELVRLQPLVKGVLTRDGEVWLVPAILPGRGPDEVVEFSHAFAAAGRDVQLAFTATMRVDRNQDGSEQLVVEGVDAWSGHYNDGNTVQENWRVVHRATLVFQMHGVLVYDVEPETNLADPAALAPPTTSTGSGAIAVTFPEVVPAALDARELAAAEQAVRELHHDRPDTPLDPGHRDYRRADPAGRWAAHGVRVYVLRGLRRRFDQLIRVPGAREVALLYFVTRDRDGERAVFVDPATLAGAAKLPRSARALVAERELVRIVRPELPEPAVQAMPLPSTRQLRRLAERPYRLGVPEPGAVPDSAAELGALISEYLATQPHWRGGLLGIVGLLGVDVDSVNAAIAAHPHLIHYTSVLAGPAEAGFRSALHDGGLVVRLTSAGGAELSIVGQHVGPDRTRGLDALGNAVLRLRDLRLLHREHEPAAWQGIPTFQLIATAWHTAGASVVDAGDLRVQHGEVAGHGLTLVTWRGELVNYFPNAMATAVRPAPERIAEALASVVRVTGRLTDADLTAVATGVVVAPETVLSVAHNVVDVDSATLRVDGLSVSRIETLRATELAVHAELAAQSVARTGADGVPVYDGMVDLVLLTVPGLDRPAARLRATPVPVGTRLTAAGNPADHWTQNHGPVTESGVHVVAAMALPHGFSGGPGLDPVGAVAGIQSYGSASGPAHFLGSELIAAFLATLRPRLDPTRPSGRKPT